MVTAGRAVADRLSVCEHVLRLGDLGRDLVAAAAAGCSAISLNRADFGGCDVEAAAAALADCGLPVSSYIDPALMRLGPETVDLDAVAAGSTTRPDWALRACCSSAASSAVARSTTPTTQSSRPSAEWASGRGTAVSWRCSSRSHPIAREYSFVHTVAHAAALARAAGAGIVVDTGASWWERDLVADIVANLDLLRAVQITDVRADELDRRRYVRAWCAQESAVPVAPLVRALVAAGYTGWFEHEVLVEAPPVDRARLFRADREWFARAVG